MNNNRNRIKIYICIFILNCIFQFSFAQEEKKSEFVLRFQPLPALHIGIPRIQGSAEFIYHKKFGVELGYGKRYLDQNIFEDEVIDTIMIKPSGDVKIIECNVYNVLFPKIYLNKGNRRLDNFIGLAYRQITDIKNKSKYYYNSTDTYPLIDNYIVKRNVDVYALKWGVYYSIKRFIVGGNAEIGIRYRKQILIHSEFDPNGLFPNGIFPWEKPYIGYSPHLNIMIKICYRIF